MFGLKLRPLQDLKQRHTMHHLVVEVAVFLIGLLQLSLQGLAGPLCSLQSCATLLPLGGQHCAPSLHGRLLLPALLLAPYLLLQLSLQLLSQRTVTLRGSRVKQPIYQKNKTRWISSSDLNLLLHLLAVFAELSVVLGEQIHLQLQLVDVRLQFLLEPQALCSAFHLHIQTGLQGLQRPLVALSARGQGWVENMWLNKCLLVVVEIIKHG